MFSVTVRDHIMVAHSFRGEIFGPAQRLHGATFVVDATFRRTELDADNIVVDIGLAARELSAVLGELNYRNLDDEPGVRRASTPRRSSWPRWSPTGSPTGCAPARSATARSASTAIAVTLHESHIAWASYERPL